MAPAAGGLEAFVPANAGLLRADAILVVDTGNFAAGYGEYFIHRVGHLSEAARPAARPSPRSDDDSRRERRQIAGQILKRRPIWQPNPMRPPSSTCSQT